MLWIQFGLACFSFPELNTHLTKCQLFIIDKLKGVYNSIKHISISTALYCIFGSSVKVTNVHTCFIKLLFCLHVRDAFPWFDMPRLCFPQYVYAFLWSNHTYGNNQACYQNNNITLKASENRCFEQVVLWIKWVCAGSVGLCKLGSCVTHWYIRNLHVLAMKWMRPPWGRPFVMA